MEYRGLKLDGFQRQAIEAIEGGHSVLVAAPTGTGKTLIADYLIEHVLEGQGEVIYTAPVKALSNQKYRQYSALFGRDKVGLVTGDLVINRDAPVRIMTTEILRNMLLEGHRSEDATERAAGEELAEGELFSPSDVALPDLKRLKAVIIDEIHFLDDPERGTVWEELLIYLPSEVRVLGLSATLSNLEEFAHWLSQIRRSEVKVVLETERTVPLQIRLANNEVGAADVKAYEKGFARWKNEQKKARKGGDEARGGRRSSRGSRNRGGKRGGRGRREEFSGAKPTTHLEMIELLGRDDFPALYFIYSRKMVEVFATKLAHSRVGRRLADGHLTRQIDEHLEAFEGRHPQVLTRKLRGMYRQGIAFHHAGLHVALKALVEELYEARLLKVLYCTSTFALGINMPARTVIFDSLTRYNGTEFVPLTIREFMQMAGRAGRRGIDPVGNVLIRQDFSGYGEVRGLLKRLMSGESEPVRSAFNLSFHSVVNLVDRFDEEHIRYMLEQSFKAYQDGCSATALRARIEVLEEEEDQESFTRRKRRDLAGMRRELVQVERPRLWEAFARKVAFLKTHGYLGPQNELQAPAKILRHIKIEELFVTELILQGVIEDLSPAELFGVMCGLVQTLPRSARVHAPDNDKWWPIFEALEAVYESDVVADGDELVGQESVFTPELMPLGERWARGESLASLLMDIRNPTDMSGDLVGAFRRAKDLVSQVRQVHREDEDRWRELSDLLRAVTRDEVEVLD
ncbi:hypothetical protein DL240_01395 [Lujinxingia litoralis]|uniref:DEAD/DEAH box helicase n=1 Tax=Lujinxingia litoralis TaxID=2211119 RepID=A0A328CCF9_9DELT|nr:DEAD/DEAH box helicase [Lujinxingia litoralis]RAL24891.1 hypothetical protein DL240_01395 [Lujinxingia litoralis]